MDLNMIDNLLNTCFVCVRFFRKNGSDMGQRLSYVYVDFRTFSINLK